MAVNVVMLVCLRFCAQHMTRVADFRNTLKQFSASYQEQRNMNWSCALKFIVRGSTCKPDHFIADCLMFENRANEYYQRRHEPLDRSMKVIN